MALERRLKKTKTLLAPNPSIPPMPLGKTNNVSHELQSHQIEIRLQNVELFTTQEKLSNSRHRENNFSKWITSRAKSIEWDTSNKNPHFVDKLTDPTQHKILAEKLLESEQRFRTIAELSPIGIYVTDKKGNCTYVNKCWKAICGLTGEEAKSHDWCKIVHPNDHRRVFDAWQRMIKSGENFALDYRVISTTGQTTWIYGVANSLHDVSGTLVGYVIINTDISLKKRLFRQICG